MDRRSVAPPPAVPDVATLVRSLARAIRALGYYDAGHPVVTQTLDDAVETVRRLSAAGRTITLAGAGATILHDAQAPALTDEPARILAEAMFLRSVIALRIEAAVAASALAAVLSPLADSADRVRLAGGVARIAAAARVAGVTILEVDFRAVFSGDRGGLAAELVADPIVSRALREVLRFEEERSGVGEAVKVELEALADTASLGGFLDDLVDAAEPAARSPRDPGRKRPPPARSLLQSAQDRRDLSISVDDVADLAAEAYLKNQALQAGRGAGEAELLQGAQVLADALVRLSPEGRFALLRRLAGEDDEGGTGGAAGGEKAALVRLGGRLDPALLVDAVASGLANEGADGEVVQAVGNLVRRLFPIEAERRRLLGALDHEQARRGQPLGGALWQELNARALGRQGLGMLALDLAKPRRKLIANAHARRSGRVPHVQGQEILLAVGAAAQQPVLADVLAVTLRDKREVSAPTLAGAHALVTALEDGGHERRADALLDALLERADVAPSEALSQAIGQLLGGARGGERTMRLVANDAGGSSKMRGGLLLRAMDEAPDRAFRDQLVQRLIRFDPGTIEALGETLADAPPARTANLMHVAVRMDGRIAAQIARLALKSPSVRVKEIALKALIESPQSPGLGVLALAAGTKGDDGARRLLALGAQDDRRLQELQLIATAALGLTRATEAVPHLVPLLTRQALLASRFVEDQRLEAARALAVNGSADAIKVLRAGAEHKKKNIREACVAALSSRRA